MRDVHLPLPQLIKGQKAGKILVTPMRTSSMSVLGHKWTFAVHQAVCASGQKRTLLHVLRDVCCYAKADLDPRARALPPRAKRGNCVVAAMRLSVSSQ